MKRVFGFLLFLGLIGAAGAYFVWNWAQGPKTAAGEPVEVTIEQGCRPPASPKPLRRPRSSTTPSPSGST